MFLWDGGFSIHIGFTVLHFLVITLYSAQPDQSCSPSNMLQCSFNPVGRYKSGLVYAANAL